MRATFSPCSASGIAHPSTTSSMSAGSMPGARRSTSSMTVAAISSGRTVFSEPFGAFPTAVRVAATITASCMISSSRPGTGKVLEQVGQGVTHFAGLAVEQVVGAIDLHELLRLVKLRVKVANELERD